MPGIGRATDRQVQTRETNAPIGPLAQLGSACASQRGRSARPSRVARLSPQPE